jgi:hypothetical protein
MAKLVREKDIESKLRKTVVDGGGLCEKFTSPGRRSVPDRIIIEGRGIDRAAHLLYDFLKENNNAAPEERLLATHAGRRAAVEALVSQVIYFVECKAPGKKATKKQQLDHMKREKLGLAVWVYDGNWHRLGRHTC